MLISSMNVYIFFLLTTLILPTSAHALNSNTPDDPLIFEISIDKKNKSCIISTAHIVPIPAEENSEKILNCVKSFKIFLTESNGIDYPYSLEKTYERDFFDPKISDLSPEIVEKIPVALKAAQYSEKEIKSITELHPIAVYRALMHSKLLTPKIDAKPNIDLKLIIAAHQLKIPIIEIEGNTQYSKTEKNLPLQKIEELTSKMVSLVLSKEKTQIALKKLENHFNNMSSQPDIDTAWKKTKNIYTEAFELPAYAIEHSSDSRNEFMTNSIIKHIKKDSALILFGSAHLGGPKSIIKLLEAKGVTVKRIN